MPPTAPGPGRAARFRGKLSVGSATIALLGLTSLFTDISSEMTLNVLPIFLTGTLGVSVAVVGVIEGIAESTAALTRLLSGRISDRLPRRLPLVIAGYGLSAATKPLFALVTGAGSAGVLRFADRVGKGVRTAPRDALLAGAASEERRGLAFGIHRAADTSGALLGILAAALLVTLAGGQLDRSDFQLVVLVAAVPAALAVMVLFFVREGVTARATVTSTSRVEAPRIEAWQSRSQRRYLAAVFLFALGNSSDAFVILRLIDVGASVAGTLLLLAAMNAAYALIAVPGGGLSDRIGRRRVLLAAYCVYAAIYAGIGVASSLFVAGALLLAYGAYYGLTEGVQRAYVADLSPSDRRGSAFGWFHMLTGIAALPASVVAGALWTEVGPAAAFLFGSACALGAAAVLLTVREARPAVGS